MERVADDGTQMLLDDALLAGVDTIIVISFDSLRTGQVAAPSEIEAVRRFLGDSDHLIFVCPHHDIGEAAEQTEQARLAQQVAEFHHHGDKAIPPRQGFGGFARTLLAGLGVPVENRFGLRPAREVDGAPAPIEAERSLDRLGLLAGVATFNLHPHLPQLERIDASASRMDVLARQCIDLAAPPHAFTQGGVERSMRSCNPGPEVFAGTALVSDTTLWSSTTGGVDSLRRLWSNVTGRARRG
ncbi:MAG: hypothetical protein WDO56_29905 [Gammaproteobacteria bacterium]